MILDKIENYKAYFNLHHRLLKAFEYLINTDLNVLPLGRIDISGDEFFILVNNYKTKKNELNLLEAHKKYMDLHYIFQGEEIIDYELLQNQEVKKAYDQKEDYILYQATESIPIKLSRGEFTLFFPGDLHLPGIWANGVSENVKKIVCKILID